MTDHEIIIEPGRIERQYWRDLWNYRELFYFLAWRNILVRYKQTAIGVAWTLIRPLLTMIVFTVIFGRSNFSKSGGKIKNTFIDTEGLACGTYGYYITIKGAKKIIRRLRHIDRPVDHFTGTDRHVNLYILQDPIVFMNKDLTKMSNIETKRKKVSHLFKSHSKISLRRKLAQFLGIYEILILSSERKRLFCGKIKRLRTYK